MRAIQLKCYESGRPAGEADRARIQRRIDELEAEWSKETNETERTNLRWRIGCLKGNHRMPRG
jgi:hypothetical protein